MDVCCAAGAPVKLEYTPRGAVVDLNGVPTYLTRPAAAAAAADNAAAAPTPKAAVIGIYDIFGFDRYPQCLQVADRVADAAGVLVALPDVFRGKPWTMDKFPPKPEDDLMGWISSFPYAGVVSKDVDAVVAALRAAPHNVATFGALGWCWGAKMAAEAAAARPGDVAAVGFLHPSLFGQEAALVGALPCPLACCSADGDPFETVQAALKGKPFEADCVVRHFAGQSHGFCGARGDFGRPEVAKAAGEAVGLVAEFFKRRLVTGAAAAATE